MLVDVMVMLTWLLTSACFWLVAGARLSAGTSKWLCEVHARLELVNPMFSGRLPHTSLV